MAGLVVMALMIGPGEVYVATPGSRSWQHIGRAVCPTCRDTGRYETRKIEFSDGVTITLWAPCPFRCKPRT